MKAIVCNEYGLPEVLTEIEREPTSLQAHEARIKVRAAGVGFVDGLLIQGKYQVKPPLPYYPGSEFSGEVIEIGESVSNLEVGQSVMGLAGNGAFSEEVVVSGMQAFPLPEDLPHTIAASLFINYATALYGLRDCGHLQEDETPEFRPGLMTLMATWRWTGCSCSAKNTTPKPPSPSLRCNT